MKIVALAGEPASGKTTIFKLLRERFPEVRKKFKFGLVRGLANEDMSIVILGVYDGSTFEGSDKLSMAVQPDLVKMLTKLRGQKATVYFEGDRLTNASLFEQFPDSVECRLVKVSEETAAARHAARGDNQPERFIKAKRTKCANLHEKFGFPWAANDTDADQAALVDWLANHAPRR